MDFGAQSLSALFPNCLHLRTNVTTSSPKLATSDAATSCWMRFPLINLYTLLGVPFVPPVHNQGVSSAPHQGLALWIIFLPTTGSFFVFFITDFLPATALFSGRFPVTFRFSSYRGWFQHLNFLPSSAQISHGILFSILLCCHFCFRPYDIAQHLLTIIIHTFCQYRIEDSDQLTRDRYH